MFPRVGTDARPRNTPTTGEQSKLANVLFTAEIQRRLAGLEQGKRKITSRSTRVLTANAVHPGNVHTEVREDVGPGDHKPTLQPHP